MHGCSSAYRASEVTVMPRKGVLLGISGAIRLGRPLPAPSHGFPGRRRRSGFVLGSIHGQQRTRQSWW